MNKQILLNTLNELNISDISGVSEKLFKYLVLLKETNQKFNLTTITDDDEILLKHFVDSVLPYRYFDFTRYENLCDIGSGAGFPGLVLAICFPNLIITLVESNGKRVSFLNLVKKELGLDNVIVMNVRVEDFKSARSKFDIVTARAVSQMSILIEICVPLLKVNGQLVAYKGPNIEEELCNAENAMVQLDARLMEVVKYELPIKKDARSLVILKKMKETRKKFPRPYTDIKSKPL